MNISIVENIPNDGFVIAHCMEHEDSIFKSNFTTEQYSVWKSDTLSISLLNYLPHEAKVKYEKRLRLYLLLD
jgi:hypothetical protein